MGLQERLDPWNAKVAHTVYSGYSNSLGDGDQCGDHIGDLTFEKAARFPLLNLAVNSDINSPFEVELLTWFDDKK